MSSPVLNHASSSRAMFTIGDDDDDEVPSQSSRVTADVAENLAALSIQSPLRIDKEVLEMKEALLHKIQQILEGVSRSIYRIQYWAPEGWEFFTIVQKVNAALSKLFLELPHGSPIRLFIEDNRQKILAGMTILSRKYSEDFDCQLSFFTNTRKSLETFIREISRFERDNERKHEVVAGEIKTFDRYNRDVLDWSEELKRVLEGDLAVLRYQHASILKRAKDTYPHVYKEGYYTPDPGSSTYSAEIETLEAFYRIYISAMAEYVLCFNRVLSRSVEINLLVGELRELVSLMEQQFRQLGLVNLANLQADDSNNDEQDGDQADNVVGVSED